MWKAIKKSIPWILFTIIYWYEELIFNLFTEKSLGIWTVVFCLLSALTIGGVAALLVSLFPRRGAKIVAGVILLLSSIPFLVEIFIYMQFKILYDLNTVVFGAGDALGGFSKDIWRLVSSPMGILVIILYLLPVISYGLAAIFLDKEKKLYGEKSWKLRGGLCGQALLAYLIFLLMVNALPAEKALYTKDYVFSDAVDDFGLMTAIRKEVVLKITGQDKKVEFDFANLSTEDMDASEEHEGVAVDALDSGESATASDADAEALQNSFAEAAGTDSEQLEKDKAPLAEITGDNSLDIDFASLAEKDTGTFKDLDTYVSTLTPSNKNPYTGIFKGKNLIFISAEAFSGDVIRPDLTPTLYRLATKGINVENYYQISGAGTTGGEFQNLFGLLPMAGGSSFKKTKNYNNYFTIGRQLNRLGYWGKAYHPNDYKYYSRNQTHNNLGYSQGFMGYGNGMEEYVNGDLWPESDLEMMEGTVDEFINHQPFDIYYMTVSGHSNYGKSFNAMSAKHWNQVEGLPYSDTVKAYIAAQLELEDALTYLVGRLEDAGIADDTVIVLSADHFPYGLDRDQMSGQFVYLSELYGHEVAGNFDRDHNRLIIWSGSLEKQKTIVVTDPVQSIDILPTLSNLFGTEYDSRLMVGRDIFSNTEALVFNDGKEWISNKGTYQGGKFTPFDANEIVSDEYIANMNTIVSNKLAFTKGLVNNDYFGHLYEEGLLPQDDYRKTE